MTSSSLGKFRGGILLNSVTLAIGKVRHEWCDVLDRWLLTFLEDAVFTEKLSSNFPMLHIVHHVLIIVVIEIKFMY